MLGASGGGRSAAPEGVAVSGGTARRMVLGGQLRRLREAKGISREAAGYSIRGSGSKISRLELGRVSFKERDVADLLTLYGITEETQRQTFLDMVAQSSQPGWWHGYNDLMPAWFQDYVGLEESASRIETFEVQFVPGLLQTERYARAIVRRGLPGACDEEVERRVMLRMQRQKALEETYAPSMWVAVDEAVLRRPIGGREVLREQLAHLLEISAHSSIELQIVPFDAGGSAAESAFTILRFAEPELPDIVYLEHLGGAMYLDKPDDVDLYTRIARRLVNDAASPENTREMLSKRLNEI